MKYRQYFNCIVLCFFLLTTFGCEVIFPKYVNVFEGPPRPKNEVAHLTNQGIFLLRFVVIDELTVEEIRTMNEIDAGSFVGYSILPGEHTVKIWGIPGSGVAEQTLSARYIDSGVTMTLWSNALQGRSRVAIFGEWTLKFSAVAGQKYFLRYDTEELARIDSGTRAYSVSPYIMNNKTKQKVSSIVEFKKRYKSNWSKYKK